MGASGGQSGTIGNAGNPDGERQLTASDSVPTTVVAVRLQKAVADSSVSSGAATDLSVGEQVRFELTVTLPAGRVPGFADR